MNNQFLLGAIALGIATFSVSVQDAKAFDLLDCGTTDPIDSATQCQYITDPLSGSANDKDFAATVFSDANTVNVNNVNTASEGGLESFFDISDWELAFKISDQESGSTDISGLFDQYENVMAVFKSGRNTTLVGYLLDGTDDFDWSNPWAALNIDGTRAQGISHISFYGSGTPTNVPTPAAVLPVLGGLFGLARRKKEEASA